MVQVGVSRFLMPPNQTVENSKRLMNHGRHPHTIHIIASVLIIALSMSAAEAPAWEITPFQIRNESPFIRIFGLPTPGEAWTVPGGRLETGADLNWGNSYSDVTNSRGDRLIIDSEIYELTLKARYGITDKWEAGVEIPVVYSAGGVLDNFIIDFHKAFGFRAGSRTEAPKNRLLYSLTRNGVEQLHIESSNYGLGDIRLTAGYNIYDGYNKALSVRASLKLPTGSSSDLRGSGSTDIALWLIAQHDFDTRLGLWSVFGTAGAMGMTTGDILPDMQKNYGFFGLLGGGWKPLSWLTLKVQIEAYSAFYSGCDLNDLTSYTARLTTGLAFDLPSNTRLDIGMSQDIIWASQPDVAFHFGLKKMF